MVSLETNAKINLTLDILGTRPDGYHEVEMIMQSIKLSDSIRLDVQTTGIMLHMNVPELPADESNLAWKAARLFMDECNIHNGVSITIEKRIPIAAGLAGGSTDAAGVLIGMNRLFKTKLSMAELCTLGEYLGSDVPFCIMGGTMLAKGRGEILQQLPDLPPMIAVLAKPPVSVSTAWAYKQYDKSVKTYHPDTRKMLSAMATGRIEDMAEALGNVLEEVTMQKHESIRAYKKILAENGVPACLMSGSGPTVFGLSATKEVADRAVRALKRTYSDAEVFVVPTAGSNII